MGVAPQDPRLQMSVLSRVAHNQCSKGRLNMERIPLKPGIPPSVQLKEAKKTQPRMGYLPHFGAKQLAKAARRAAKKKKPAPKGEA